MPNSLLTGISGLRSHQQMLEVVGHNLANVNTTGYKAERALFSDLMYETLRGGSMSNLGVLGGVNPIQVGTGAHLSRVDRSVTQGNLTATGQQLDMAIDGDGFFVVSNGVENIFTRAGAFSIDESGVLVDPATGYEVQRFGTTGEPSGSAVSFQTAGDNSIHIPVGASIPGDLTAEISLAGNLSANATGAIAQRLSSSVPFTSSGGPATATTLLNDLDSNVVPYSVGDSVLITGTDSNGTPVSTSFSVTATTTLGDLVAAINANFANSTATLDANGRIVVEANSTGPALLGVSLADGLGNTGSTSFSSHGFLVSATGKDADVVRGGVEVFDARGTAHTLGLTFTRQVDGTWNLSVSMDPSEGTILDGEVNGIQFQNNGTFAQVLGTGLGDAGIEVQFTGDTTIQNVAVNFGTAGEYDGLTALGAPSALSVDSDGHPPGTLTGVQVDSDGTLHGLASNGITIPLATLMIASFRNPAGLLADGNNYFKNSLSSGGAEYGVALSGGRGALRSSHLEESNVDLALEFTRLIIAQRGFSANARTITVTDQILEELTGLVR